MLGPDVSQYTYQTDMTVDFRYPKAFLSDSLDGYECCPPPVLMSVWGYIEEHLLFHLPPCLQYILPIEHYYYAFFGRGNSVQLS